MHKETLTLPTELKALVNWFEAASEYDPALRTAVCYGLRHLIASYDGRPVPLDEERRAIRDWARVRLEQLDDGP